MTVEIIIHPLSALLDYRTLDNLRNDISREFENIKVVATSNNSKLVELKKDTIFQSLFNQHRNQWYSPKLLDCFFEKFRPNKDTKLLFILDVDAYSDGLNYVLGETYPKGGLGIIYLPRIRQEFYGLKPDNELFFERMAKESVHELGHIFGFVHCPNKECVMHFVTF
jgi:archaemetzincin